MAKDDIVVQQLLAKYDSEHILYALEFEERLAQLESQLHSVEDPMEIAMGAMIAAAEFYDGDWCGIIEADLDMEAWKPLLWYNRGTEGMTETSFHELENTNALDHWYKALYECKPVIIPDTSVVKAINPVEYELYSRCSADSVLAVPFWKNPVGFMIIRNPKRFITKSSYLQMAAYVTFSSVTEMKLLERTKNAYSPEKIKDDKDVIINLFGDIEIYTSKGFITEEMINSPKFCRILVYLLLHERRPKPAKVIWEEIWPDDDIEKASDNIRALHFRFRDTFSIISDYRLLVTTPQGYQLNPELNIMTDVDAFDEYCQQAQSVVTKQTRAELIKNAVNTYKGDLFVSARAEHWIMHHEIGYKYKCLHLYDELMKECFEDGNYVGIEYYAKKALEIEKANMSAYYWTIRSYRKMHSPALAKGQINLAKYALDEKEFEELMEILEKNE